MSKIGLLRECRLKRGLTLREVGVACEVSHRTVLLWERSVHTPEPQHILKLSRLYEITPLEIKEAVNDKRDRH